VAIAVNLGFWGRLVLAAVLALSAAMAAFVLPAAKAAETASIAESAGPRIALGADQFAEVSNVRMFRHDESSVCSFEATIRNGGGTDLLLDDYYFMVKTRSGSVLNFALLPEDTNRNIVPAGGSEIYRFYGTVANGIDAGSLVLETGRWDFNSAALTTPLGTVALSDALARHSGKEAEVSAKNAKLQGFISDAATRSLGKNKEVTWTATFRNPHTTPVVLPEWSFWLQSSQERVYSMTPDRKPEGAIVDAGADISYILTAVLPAETDLTNAGLVLTRTISEANKPAKVHVPAAYLPAAAGSNDVEAGAARTFKAEEDTFAAALESLERWQWDDRDLITASVTLVNASDRAAPVPRLGGTFRGDNSREWPAQIVPTDTVKLLQPGQSTRFFLQANLDHAETVRSWDILLQEQIELDGKTQTVHRTAWNKQAAASAKEVSAGQKSDMSGISGKWEYTASAPMIYDSPSGKIAAVRIDAVNTDKKHAAVPRWVTQFVTADGTVYPAEVEAAAQRVIPQGKASLMAWSVLPKGADIRGLKLMLGLAVTGGKLSGAADKPDSFLQAAVFRLPENTFKPGDNLDELVFYPYTLKISEKHKPYWNFNSQRGFFEINFSFDYTLNKDLSVVSEMKKRRVIVEVVDGQGEELHEEAYALEPGEADKTGWKIGTDTVKWIVDKKFLDVNTSQYTVNVYEEFQPGYRRLVGSVTSDWTK